MTIIQCPTCHRQVEVFENSVLVICKCGEVIFDKDGKDGRNK